MSGSLWSVSLTMPGNHDSHSVIEAVSPATAARMSVGRIASQSYLITVRSMTGDTVGVYRYQPSLPSPRQLEVLATSPVGSPPNERLAPAAFLRLSIRQICQGFACYPRSRRFLTDIFLLSALAAVPFLGPGTGYAQHLPLPYAAGLFVGVALATALLYAVSRHLRRRVVGYARELARTSSTSSKAWRVARVARHAPRRPIDLRRSGSHPAIYAESAGTYLVSDAQHPRFVSPTDHPTNAVLPTVFSVQDGSGDSLL